MENELKIGFCHYCKHTVMVPASAGSTQEEWDAEATLRCKCGEASKIRWRQCVLEQFKEDIKNFDIGLKTRELLVAGAELIADGALKSMTVKTDLDAVVQISLKGSAIFMRKTVKNTEELLSEGAYRQ